MDERWWLRLRFMEGQWEIVDQTQDWELVKVWDDEIDAKEDRTGLDHEWVVLMPYGVRRLYPGDVHTLAVTTWERRQ